MNARYYEYSNLSPRPPIPMHGRNFTIEIFCMLWVAHLITIDILQMHCDTSFTEPSLGIHDP